MKNLPIKPGCYIFKDEDNKIIYIGKAKNIKKRVKSYFTKKHPDLKTNLLVKNIKKIDYIVTRNEMEAFLLESNLIKEHKPKYNIQLKDDKKYAYLLLTNEPYPRLLHARNKQMNGEYFGPFVDGTARTQIKKLLTDKFKIRTCKTFPKRPCLKYHMKLCKAPCVKKQTKSDYNEQIEKVRLFLKGNIKDLEKNLIKEMDIYSKTNKFEKAMLLKEQIHAINYLTKKQIVELDRKNEENIIIYQIVANKVFILIFTFKDGILQNKQEFVIDYFYDFFDEFIKVYYTNNKIPNEIIVENNVNDKSIGDYLSKVANKNIKILKPIRGVKKQLLDLAKENMHAWLKEKFQLAYEIREKIKCKEPIHTIECFDISHLSGTDVVASMVHFKEGRAIKSKYRKFKIKSFSGNDDFRAMGEVVRRRYTRLKEENKEFPDLIMVDGGLGQLNVAKKELKKLDLNIPIISLAKKEEEIYVTYQDKPFNYKNNTTVMKLLIRIRNEAHRFAITYQRSLRKKKLK